MNYLKMKKVCHTYDVYGKYKFFNITSEPAEYLKHQHQYFYDKML